MKRVHYIDCLRIFACFLVILIHCNYIPIDPSLRIYTQVLNVLGSPSSELFLAISGSLLLPVKISEKEFYKKRFTRLLIPLFFWSLVALYLKYVTGDIIASDVLFLLANIPFHSYLIGPYWFLYTISAMYLIAPIITPYISGCSSKKLRGLLIAWGITLLFPYLNFLYDGFYNFKEIEFISPYYVCSGFTGYMLLGYYMRKYPIKFSSFKKGVLSLVCLYFFSLLPIVYIGFFMPDKRDFVLNNVNLIGAIQVVIIFSLFQLLFTKENVITVFARRLTNYTFGIYLLHVFVVPIILIMMSNSNFSHPLFVLPTAFLISFCICLILVYCLSRIKILKVVVGVK